jgi:threonine synthase
MILCNNCKRPYPEQGIPYQCIHCGGTYDIPILPIFRMDQVQPALPGLWRYRQSFGLNNDVPMVTLGEGNTPLVWAPAFGRQVAFKLEYQNPSGSFKDRGSAVLISLLLSKGVRSVVEDSSGNAGASLAAYAARGGMQVRIFVPGYASGPKLAQIEAYGARVVPIQGTRSNTSEAVRLAAEKDEIYASHAYLPHVLLGYATLAYELLEQMGGSPGTVIVPAGQGNLLLAIGRGFNSLKAAGLIQEMPALVGVQVQACAPLWAVSSYGAAGLGWVSEGQTLAEGVRIKYPVRGDEVLRIVEKSGGRFIAVAEEEILAGRDQLAHLGFYVEPTSAIVWSALMQITGHLPEPIVVVLTGSGFKSQE